MNPLDPEPRTPADEQLLEYLRQIRAIRETMRKPSEFVYSCVEDFLLKHGTFFQIDGLPATIRPMRLGECYENAWRVSNRSKAYHYVEGVALGVIPLSHAWLVDRDGHAYDPTWAGLDSGPGTSYFGVELNLDEVRLSRRHGSKSLLEDFRRDFPALTGAEVVAKDAWFHR